MLDMLSNAGCRVVDAPMKTDIKLLPDQTEILDDRGNYQKLVDKLNYLTIIKPDITFVVSVISHFFSALTTTH